MCLSAWVSPVWTMWAEHARAYCRRSPIWWDFAPSDWWVSGTEWTSRIIGLNEVLIRCSADLTGIFIRMLRLWIIPVGDRCLLCWWWSFVQRFCRFNWSLIAEHLVVCLWFMDVSTRVYTCFSPGGCEWGRDSVTRMLKLEDRNDLVRVSAVALALLSVLQSSTDKASKNSILETFPWNLIHSLRGPPPTEVGLNVLFAAVASFCVGILLGGIVWHPFCALGLSQRFSSP